MALLHEDGSRTKAYASDDATTCEGFWLQSAAQFHNLVCDPSRKPGVLSLSDLRAPIRGSLLGQVQKLDSFVELRWDEDLTAPDAVRKLEFAEPHYPREPVALVIPVCSRTAPNHHPLSAVLTPSSSEAIQPPRKLTNAQLAKIGSLFPPLPNPNRNSTQDTFYVWLSEKIRQSRMLFQPTESEEAVDAVSSFVVFADQLVSPTYKQCFERWKGVGVSLCPVSKRKYVNALREQLVAQLRVPFGRKKQACQVTERSLKDIETSSACLLAILKSNHTGDRDKVETSIYFAAVCSYQCLNFARKIYDTRRAKQSFETNIYRTLTSKQH